MSGEAKVERHGRLSTVIAISIAVVSVLGALVSWRVEVANSNASDLDQEAVAASVVQAQLKADADAVASQEAANHARLLRLDAEGVRLGAAPPDAVNPGCKATNSPQSILDWQARAVCNLASIFWGSADVDYLNPAQGSSDFASAAFDAAKFSADVAAFDSQFKPPSDPAPFIAERNHAADKEHRLLYLSLGLLVALAALTIARITKRRSRAWILAGVGWFAMLGSVITLGILEL